RKEERRQLPASRTRPSPPRSRGARSNAQKSVGREEGPSNRASSGVRSGLVAIEALLGEIGGCFVVRVVHASREAKAASHRARGNVVGSSRLCAQTDRRVGGSRSGDGGNARRVGARARRVRALARLGAPRNVSPRVASAPRSRSDRTSSQ